MLTEFNLKSFIYIKSNEIKYMIVIHVNITTNRCCSISYSTMRSFTRKFIQLYILFTLNNLFILNDLKCV